MIVDDEMISRGYMELFIKPSKRFEVAATLPFASQAIKWCRTHEVPDLIIMDVMMAEGVDGLSAAEIIKREFPQVKVLIATSMADVDWIEKAKRAGVDSFWFKSYSNLPLLDVLDRTMNGEQVYPEEAPEVMLGNLPASGLTAQQRILLRYLTEGLSNREIAAKMYLSPNTVKDYLDALMEKAGIHSRTALVSQASRLGIVVSEQDRLMGSIEE